MCDAAFQSVSSSKIVIVSTLLTAHPTDLLKPALLMPSHVIPTLEALRLPGFQFRLSLLRLNIGFGFREPLRFGKAALKVVLLTLEPHQLSQQSCILTQCTKMRQSLAGGEIFEIRSRLRCLFDRLLPRWCRRIRDCASLT